MRGLEDLAKLGEVAQSLSQSTSKKIAVTALSLLGLVIPAAILLTLGLPAEWVLPSILGLLAPFVFYATSSRVVSSLDCDFTSDTSTRVPRADKETYCAVPVMKEGRNHWEREPKGDHPARMVVNLELGQGPVFLSYSKSDAGAVALIASKLKELGLSVVADEWQDLDGLGKSLRDIRGKSGAALVFISDWLTGADPHAECLLANLASRDHAIQPVLLPSFKDSDLLQVLEGECIDFRFAWPTAWASLTAHLSSSVNRVDSLTAARIEAKNLRASVCDQAARYWVPDFNVQLVSPWQHIRRLGIDLKEPEEIVLEGEPHKQAVKIAGLIDRKSNAIAVAKRFEFESRRFTAAHELGHWQLHKNIVFFRDTPLSGAEHAEPARPLCEREADYFAAELLMPEDLLREAFTYYFGVNYLSEDTQEQVLRHLSSAAGTRLQQKDFADIGVRDRALLAARSLPVGDRKPHRSLAKAFEVSEVAMATQLEALRLVG